MLNLCVIGYKRTRQGLRIPNSAEISLDELARRLRSDDSEAFAELYRRLNQSIVRYIQRFVDSTPQSYDILQDVYLKLWEQRQKIRPDTNIKALLYTMARNRSLNVIRKESRQTTLESTELDGLSSQGQMPDARFEAEVLKENVDEWLSRLPKRRAEAFMLSRFHDLKYKDVAAIMGLSERTVQTHVLHALRDLRVMLAQHRQRQ